MKDNSIDIVLDKKQIFVGSINKDITEEILKLVNKTY
jgi:Skp family chaperone for outer membrane proteins